MKEYFGTTSFWITLIVIVIVVVLMFFSRKILELYQKKFIDNKEKDNQVSIQRRTSLHFIFSIIKAFIIVMAVILILQVNGVNVTSLVAGLGILSAIIGLALQDVIKDIVTGLRIVSEHYFGVGDVVKFEELEGEVISVSIRSTKLRDLSTNDIITISNRNFVCANKLSGEENIDIPISFEEDKEKAKEVLSKACEEIKKHKKVTGSQFRGIQDIEDSNLTFRVWYKCSPKDHPQTHRDVIGIILKNLDEAGIVIPYNKLDVHQK